MTTYFDIETGPLPDDQLAKIKPVFEPPANYKDPEKIKANLAEQEASWRDRAALDATTGQVLMIGLITKDQFQTIEGPEKSNLEEFWSWMNEQLAQSIPVVGFCIFHFDLPFLIRRSWINGVKVPAIVTSYNKYRPWNDSIVDLAEAWSCGNREQRVSLDTLAKSLGVGAKNGDGKDFAALLATDKAKAIEYLKNDLQLTKAVYERMFGAV